MLCTVDKMKLDVLIPFLREALQRRERYTNDPTTPREYIREVREYISSLKWELKSIMPEITFAHGFWRSVTELSDSQAMAQVFTAIASEHSCLFDHVAATFFREVVYMCNTIQATKTRRHGFLPGFFGQQPTNDLAVRIFDRHVANITYTTSGRLKVRAITMAH